MLFYPLFSPPLAFLFQLVKSISSSSLNRILFLFLWEEKKIYDSATKVNKVNKKHYFLGKHGWRDELPSIRPNTLCMCILLNLINTCELGSIICIIIWKGKPRFRDIESTYKAFQLVSSGMRFEPRVIESQTYLFQIPRPYLGSSAVVN